MTELIEKDLSYKLQGALMEVYNALGPGFREESYKQALALELKSRSMTFECERAIPVIFKGTQVDEYRLDLLVEGRIIVDLKAVGELHPRFHAQVLSHLRATGLPLGYLVNFGAEELIMKRVLNPRPRCNSLR